MWYLLLIAVLIFVGYKLAGSKPKSAVKEISDRLQVKPHLIDEMLVKMGPERGAMFVADVCKDERMMLIGVYTFVIFQLIKNDHIENVKWWKQKLRDVGVNPFIDLTTVQAAFVYLHDAGADPTKTRAFVKEYNSIS